MAALKICTSSYVFTTTTNTNVFPNFCHCRWKSKIKITLSNPLMPPSISSNFLKHTENSINNGSRRSAHYSTESAILVYETREKKGASDEDPIASFNQRLRKEKRTRNQPIERVDPEEAQKYINDLKEKRKRGLEKLKQANLEGNDKTLSYVADPEALVEGDYVVHKKVGIGQFVGIKKSGDKKYVYIQYSDGMAKLSVDQARRLLYRYSL